MEQLTTYRAKGKEIGIEILFKYRLNGSLKGFEIEEGELNHDQKKWLFTGYLPKGTYSADAKELLTQLKLVFPADEESIKNSWMKEAKYLKYFDIEVSPADTSFDALWQIYDYKLGKQDAERAFKKLKQGEIIEIFLDVPKYKNWLKANPKIAQLYLATYINAKRYQDERPVNLKGKNFNPVLQNLATNKTNK
ncbi:hypothetical protein V3Q90_12475 [Flavobacterium oreochromis]|uniref:hypothetical protein n=1 Tax=Flavobacterium oreochromis TaxID=2906078 RepID=UPI000CDA8828|nr:hypothetical protein BWK58_06395 [Flavobacterium columnare]